jgi:hypothetical protein
MSFSYSSIIGNKAMVTLPSVESWGTNNNILRDPPKSIMTRRIDKVNQDGSLNEMLYHSGDRFAENINVYARGVNPMVSVEYGNNNSYSKTQANLSDTGKGGFYQAGKLPYRVMNGGAFHPPILRQEQLLPLSRLPRNVTFQITNKSQTDYAKSALCDFQPNCHRQVVKDKVEGFILPTKTMKLDNPTKEHFVVDYINENPMIYSNFTNLSAQGETEVYRDEKNLQRNMPGYTTEATKSVNYATFVQPDKEILLDGNLPVYDAFATKSISLGGNGVLDDTIELLKNLPSYQTAPKKSYYTGVSAVYNPDSIHLEENMPHHMVLNTKTKNAGGNGVLNDYIELNENTPHHMVTNTKTKHTGGNGVLNDYIELNENVPHHVAVNNKSFQSGERIILNDEIALSENTPHYSFQANKGDARVHFQNEYENELDFDVKLPHIQYQSPKNNTKVNIDNSSKQFNRLHEVIHPGSFEGKATIPTSGTNVKYNSNYSTNKRELAQKIMKERM